MEQRAARGDLPNIAKLVVGGRCQMGRIAEEMD
jgi:hypothetical protein